MTWGRADDDSWRSSAARIGTVGVGSTAQGTKAVSEALLRTARKARWLAGTVIASMASIWRQRLVA